MSADNGYVIQRRADGRVALQMYFLSNESLPNPDEAREDEVYATSQLAEQAYDEMEEKDPYLSEYGLTVVSEGRFFFEEGWYALRNRKTGKFIGLDSPPGGYWSDVDSLTQAYLWPTAELANRYNAIFSWKDYDKPIFELHEVKISAAQIDSPTGDELKKLRIDVSEG